MNTAVANPYWQNFLGASPDWYKKTIIAFLIINPILLYVAGPFVTGWVLIGQFIFTLALPCSVIPCNLAACSRLRPSPLVWRIHIRSSTRQKPTLK